MAEMKNQKLLNKALNLLPDLVETKVDAVQTVELYKNDNSIVIEQAVDYRKRVLKREAGYAWILEIIRLGI